MFLSSLVDPGDELEKLPLKKLRLILYNVDHFVRGRPFTINYLNYFASRLYINQIFYAVFFCFIEYPPPFIDIF